MTALGEDSEHTDPVLCLCGMHRAHGWWWRALGSAHPCQEGGKAVLLS